jgi:LmbE family N-acetylglucosaminyl deacetylase
VVAVSQTRDASPSGAVFLSPHNDDETLFGSFTLLRERPRVITVLRSHVQEQRGTGVTYQEREAENAAALEVLGIAEWEQWTYPDDDPPWSEIRDRLASVPAERVYAPAIERRGHAHHNAIGELANAAWPGKVIHYTTYTTWGRTRRGDEVPWEHEWVLLKLRALSC